MFDRMRETNYIGRQIVLRDLNIVRLGQSVKDHSIFYPSTTIFTI